MISTTWIFGEITDRLAETVWRDVKGAKKNGLQVVINSPGGLVTAAWAIHDVLYNPNKSPLILATGMCGSAANIIYHASNRRAATANTIFSFHNVSSTHWETGAYEDVRMRELLIQNIGRQSYECVIGKRAPLGVLEARELGIVTEPYAG